MKTQGGDRKGMTLIEVLAIIAILAILAVLLLPVASRSRDRAQHIRCISYLKQLGLGFRQWANDYTNSFSMSISTNVGGTQEYTTAGDVFRHFQVLSNEINTTLLLACPSDLRQRAKDFETLSNTNISYFIGLDASEIYPSMFLAGDRNLTNGTLSPDGILELSSNSVVGWTVEMHNGKGNVLFSDSSVQSLNISKLREALASTGVTTNRLALPLD